jgi:hypothetical protein
MMTMPALPEKLWSSMETLLGHEEQIGTCNSCQMHMEMHKKGNVVSLGRAGGWKKCVRGKRSSDSGGTGAPYIAL